MQGEEPGMESNLRYYSRRAYEEQMAATRAITPQAQEWHRQLAEGFRQKVQEHQVQIQMQSA
jgi:hypothetical protein